MAISETEDAIAAIAAKVVDAGAAPLAAVGVSVFAGGGWTSQVGGSARVIFDLASVTKPMTAIAFARSGLAREKSLSHYLPEVRGTAGGEASIELLLSHRAGLLPHVKLWDDAEVGGAESAAARLSTGERRIEALIEVARATRPDLTGSPPYPPVYSDVGYLLVGEAMARALGFDSAGAVVGALVIAPLRLRAEADEWLGRPADLASVANRVIAPTEVVPWRGGAVVGEVHDENAWVFGGRSGCGHAGMFGTVAGVLAFGRAVLEATAHATGPYADSDLAWTLRERPGGTLRAGWDGKSKEGSSAGTMASPDAYGHLGFTGTSIWIDESRSAIVSLLSNRVYPARENARIRELRPAVHDDLFSIADEIAAKVKVCP